MSVRQTYSAATAAADVGNWREYARLLRVAADEGHAQAKENLGSWHLEGLRDPDGWVIRKSVPRGVALLREASELGDGLAACSLAYCYDTGLGVQVAKDRARTLYLKAFHRGVTLAAINLAALARERGNSRVELYWLRKAARQGEPEGVLEMAERAVRLNWSQSRVAPVIRDLQRLVRRGGDAGGSAAQLLARIKGNK